jgi:hypothetical protein
MVAFTARPLYPREKSPLDPLDRRLGGPQSRSGRLAENSWPYRDSNFDTSVVQPVASRYTDYANPAPKFPSNPINDYEYFPDLTYRPSNTHVPQ